ncbi:hypothetical protein [Aliiruegeria sabulilitoris]|uniref:hypothetical protein n=1 Tax=Aliiruegeria sabulilitoris TaxID=1510458 RepID=UPI001E5A9253|nr:hypothetical protein [Aliiruegeria sabulilitoris]
MASWPHMNTGVKISGLAHIGLLLWMAIGGLFSFDRDRPLDVSEVTLITGEQFAAMVAAGSQAPAVSDAPETPAQPQAAEQLETPVPEAAPELATPPEAAEEVQPESEPQVEEAFETPRAEVSPVAPPAPTAPDTPDGASPVLAPENPPAPDAAPRVAPRPVERPEPDANVAEQVQQAARREQAPEAPPVPEAPEETTAPEEAGTVIETEATDEAGGTAQSELAPPGALRPLRRPDRPTPPAPAPAAEPEPARDPLADAIAGAVAEATASAPAEAAGQGTARTGPPLSAGEKDALRLGVQRCWNVGSLSTDALRTTITVYFEMDQNARPVSGTIRMLDSVGGSAAAANQAFEAARRAIIRCGVSGYGLPPEKYDQWREVEVVFNPDYMRVR